ncbi:hypothetical protein BN1211_2900 [Cyberlindnera jadinii]|uniref:Uncharacterized protein n=1 Tax=Cyberlindnera jadinii (strain ATCC 18201 / CBS 1600 / BCRC 20928 / JCM 3617 / NBRC 0987 / NRRL Y-1542) TaxID=983966 RepID=A0A0H5C3P2_CYBJN|nr:hypothetical protein BN1211_2900 [Cyberlindnera jadinii]
MAAILEENQDHGLRLDDQNLDNLRTASEDPVLRNLRVKAEAAIQRHTRNASLSTAGTNRKYFAALLSLPVDDREGEIVAYIIIHVIALLTILIKLRGPPMTSGTIEDILSLEELKTFMTIVFEKI